MSGPGGTWIAFWRVIAYAGPCYLTQQKYTNVGDLAIGLYGASPFRRAATKVCGLLQKLPSLCDGTLGGDSCRDREGPGLLFGE